MGNEYNGFMLMDINPVTSVERIELPTTSLQQHRAARQRQNSFLTLY